MSGNNYSKWAGGVVNHTALCCLYWNESTTDDGELIYPDICECICHTEELNEHD